MTWISGRSSPFLTPVRWRVTCPGSKPRSSPRVISRAPATILNVLENTRLITEAARTARVASPLLDICHTLYAETDALGRKDLDMVAVIRAIEQRTAGAR